MGDVVHTLPAVALIKRLRPEAELHWLVEPAWAPLLDGNPDVARVVTFPFNAWRKKKLQGAARKEFREALRRLRGERFDQAIVFQPLLKTAVIARLTGAAECVGFDTSNLREPLSRFLLHRQVAANRTHVVDKNLALVRGLFDGAGTEAPPVRLPPGEQHPDEPRGRYLLASPHAGWRSKEWPPERYAELAETAWRERGMPLVVTGAPSKAEALRAIAGKASEGACLSIVSSLPELIGMTRRAAAVVGVDSGPTHLAAAIEAPGVALFGPTDPARNGPYGQSLQAIRRTESPTSYKRDDRYSESMISITADEVWAALQPLLPGPESV